MNFSSLVAHKAGDVCFPERQKQEVFAATSKDGFTVVWKQMRSTLITLRRAYELPDLRPVGLKAARNRLPRFRVVRFGVDVNRAIVEVRTGPFYTALGFPAIKRKLIINGVNPLVCVFTASALPMRWQHDSGNAAPKAAIDANGLRVNQRSNEAR